MIGARLDGLDDERKREIRRKLFNSNIPFRPEDCSCGKCDAMEYNHWVVGDEACNAKLNFFRNVNVLDEFENFFAKWQKRAVEQVTPK